MNILDADAFASQVSSVTLYVYDSEGKLALKKTESGSALASPGYAMDIDLLPGNYTMLAWCEGTPAYSPNASFAIGGGDNPASITELSATLPLRNSGTDSNYYSDLDIVPLYYGYSAEVKCPDTYGTVTLPAIDLMKDTNLINVALENLEGTEIEPDAVSVSIEASNSQLDWTNAVTGDTKFAYKPWSVDMISSERPNRSGEDVTNPVTGIFAEMTMGRLMVDRKPILVVNRKRDNKDIIRIDLVKFLCMVKGHYGNYSDQEYLDRMDRHTLTFFIDADLNWYMAGGVNINGWKVVPPQDMEL